MRGKRRLLVSLAVTIGLVAGPTGGQPVLGRRNV
jgi:hypothetical protein